MRGSRGLMSRPSLEEVHAYRAWVDDAMGHFLENEEVNEGLAALIELGLNHEQQHQELILTDLKHALWSMPLRPERRAPSARGEQVSPRSGSTSQAAFTRSATRATVFPSTTKAPGMKFYCVLFNLASRLVTNAEYLQFMRDGGYQKPELWLSDGWDTVCAQGWNSPLYWERTAIRNLAGIHLRRNEGSRSLRAGLPRELTTKPTPSRAGARHGFRGKKNGKSPRCRLRLSRRKALCRKTVSFIRGLRAGAACGSSSAMFGSGPRVLTSAIPDFSRRRAWSANTTENSCATRWCCAADPAPRRRATFAPAIAIFFLRTRAGNSWA